MLKQDTSKLPDEPPKVESYVKSKSYEYAADITLSDIRRFPTW